ncbi:MAG: lysophospholipid acyltransferase family protein [Gemmatimonadota bacterium]|nr:lysophospholipid acyltransferase family protein [Gemmatimonadota bacterium]
MAPTLIQWVEYAALRVIATVLRPFGWRAASAVGAFIGGLGYWPFAIRARRVERAIRACFPEFDEARLKEVARASYRGLGRVTIESIVLSRQPREGVLAAFIEPVGFDLLERALAPGKGAVLVAGHLGNWELSAAYMSARGVPVDAIAMHMANPLSDGFFKRTRERFGMQVVFDDEAVRRIPRAFREGRAVGFLSDQGAKGLASTFVPFFGRPARTPRGAAVFALRGDLPIVFVAAIRQPDLRYQVHFEAVPLVRTGDKEHDVDATVLAYTQVLERYVRRFPEQYFWQHRRWRRQPDDTPLELREP